MGIYEKGTQRSNQKFNHKIFHVGFDQIPAQYKLELLAKGQEKGGNKGWNLKFFLSSYKQILLGEQRS